MNKSMTTLRYQVDITDTFETPEGYSYEGLPQDAREC